MPIDPMLSQPAFHPLYAKLLASLLRDAGIAPTGPLALVDALPEDRFVDLAEMQALIAFALAASPQPDLGLQFGALAQVFMHGPVGYAAVASPNLQAALDTIIRYATLRTQAVAFSWRDEGEVHAFCLQETQPLGPARQFVLEALMVINTRLLRTLSGQAMPQLACYLPWPKPAWLATYTTLLGDRCYFDAPQWAIRLPCSLLATPCLTADAGAFATASQDCERKLAEAHGKSTLLTQVRQRLQQQDAPYPTAEQMALALHLSSRSLLRKLKAEGVSYQALLDEIRYTAAQWQLRHSDEPIARIAERLGMADGSNFSRQFHRWAGMTPSAYRQRHRPLP